MVPGIQLNIRFGPVRNRRYYSPAKRRISLQKYHLGRQTASVGPWNRISLSHFTRRLGIWSLSLNGRVLQEGNMKKVAWAVAAIAMMSGVTVASAADMAVKARPAPVAIFTWTGVYI